MKKHNKWKMNRAGLLNFWYYDNEIFDFADGKLLLRGSNGSGKSVTMQSILPVLLDGKKSPDRLDPFGSKARKMEDYLLGEKDIVDREERTGYLFIEYKREDTNQYITTGIGLQARRHKSMNSWYFIITDNRRIGEDFALYETERHGGETQQIPLSRTQLENRVQDGGHVVRTQGEYMKLVNKYIFGFEEIDAYEDLIKLLIQLRSPKLSKDFKPTVIYEILEAALPPLTDEDLRHLSDTIEHMDQTKQQIEQLEREQDALNKLIKRYDAYNEYAIADRAHEYVEAKKRHTKEERLLNEKEAIEATLKEEIKRGQEQSVKLEQTKEVLEKKQERLRQHKVWNLEKERATEQEALEEVKKELERKNQQLTNKKNDELETKSRLKALDDELYNQEQQMGETLRDLEADAEASSFTGHSLNQQDFHRNKESDFDFKVWTQEAENHFQNLESITEGLRYYENLREQIVAFQKKLSDLTMERDKTKQVEQDWLALFEKDKQEKLDEIHRWAADHSFLPIEEKTLQQSARQMEQLYEPLSFETVRNPFVQVSNDFQMDVNQEIATKKSDLSTLEKEKTGKEAELAEWKAKRDPEPPNQREETREARKLLEASNHAFVPFYEAVEFQDHVPENVRNQIEAVLLDTGLLDALIAEEQTTITHDRIIKADPHMMAHTLRDYLTPDLAAERQVSSELIDEVLRSILVDEEVEGKISIQENGSYTIGIVHGHAVPVKSVRFIGKNARKRYREEQITRLEEEITGLNSNYQSIEQHVHALSEKVEDAKQAMIAFPVDHDLQVSFSTIKEKRFDLEQLQKSLQQVDRDMEITTKAYQEKKRELDRKTRELNITFSFTAYNEAKSIMRDYEKALRSLITTHTTYVLQQQNRRGVIERVDELMEEVDELQGELNERTDKESKLVGNIEEIVKQLEMQGVADIRNQIQEVQASLKQTEQELMHNRTTLPQNIARLETLTEEISQHHQKLHFQQQMIHVWADTIGQEMNYGFIDLPDDLQKMEERAKWIDKHFKQLLKEKDPASIEGQLTSIYFEQHSNLMEYRLSDQHVPAVEAPWMREQEWTDEQRMQIEHWRQKAARRLIQLDYQGKKVDPYFVRDRIDQDRLQQQHLLDDQDRQLYEEILFDSVGKKLRSRISKAQAWTEKMDKLMAESDSSSGLSFSIRWKPRTAETEEELDTKELVELLRRDSRLLKDEDMDMVIDHFRSKIERAKELVDIKGEGSTLLQVLKDVLDYRNWFSFVLSYKREREPKRELTNHAFYKFSGGEKAMAMYIPLFTACYSRYSEADPTAPYIITLDEAFAGVDEDNISVMFRIMEELGFDYMMNSQVLWGDYDTISNLSINELVRPKNSDFVTVIRYHWGGKKRSLLVKDQAETVTNR
ncbi:chromosome segregation protein SMC [Oceanobacillus picturae]|uniref:Chromosome segregation protein SMC n=1 Tax=Oceanobacillus picturae TaxID=171693 RepID=W9AK68_9BACI|nr:TIGR02680 family protein [Oceanobacillus picturae]CDO03317.1 chromosome segregation protein SMC [Oceanobacillus picturae]